MSEIDIAGLRAGLAGRFAGIEVVATTGSTNADLREAAAKGAPDRTVLIAEEQTAGVGRRARHWNSPKGTGIYVSVLLRPGVPFAALGSLSVVAGLAVREVATRAGVTASLKWPNDVLIGSAKCAGILSEAVAGEQPTVVLGIGLNVLPLGEEISPAPGGLTPTSLAENGATTTDRTELAGWLLTALAEREALWRAASGDLASAGLLGEYRLHCATLGQNVRILLPNGDELTGLANAIDDSGQLELLLGSGERHTVFAGDVVHVRQS